MPEGFVSVATFWSVEMARLAKFRLESEGINVELEGATTGTLAIDVTGGVKLRVKDTDFERAQTILNTGPRDQSDYVPTPEELAAKGIDVERRQTDEAEHQVEGDDRRDNVSSLEVPSAFPLLKVPLVVMVLVTVLLEFLILVVLVLRAFLFRSL